ncbi:hypothetical protein CEP52_003437 [Fusarium oligoseptatum]|uniref:Uncharacterized protein n=1 Tax=Fusarium oligoseptatum TaxID=2604345 RepID=A0A428U8L9_9HYPO|nr:hypothetical protein CEP52_003437 [Fusarium oligoseptatum]
MNGYEMVQDETFQGKRLSSEWASSVNPFTKDGYCTETLPLLPLSLSVLFVHQSTRCESIYDFLLCMAAAKYP